MTIEILRDHEERLMPLFRGDYRYGGLWRLAQGYVVGRHVLDLRCTTGELAVELAVQGYEVTALDGHARGAQITNTLGRRRGLTRNIASAWDFTRLLEHVGAQAFDTVISIDVLSHAKDDEAAMADVAAVLRPGGRLILVAPAFPALHGRRDAMFGHVRRYTRQDLRVLLERHGLEIARMRYWNFLALPLYVLTERFLHRPVSEKLRWPQTSFTGRILNQFLRWWYLTVENRLALPWGLSLFVVATKR